MTFVNIALTGGMGCGKSTAASIFGEMGVEVADLDAVCAKMLSTDAEIREKTVRLLGGEAFDRSGKPDRAFIAKKVFSDTGLLREYESIIHPAALKNAGLDVFCGNDAGVPGKSGANGVRVYEIPLLYEKKLDKYFEICVSVLCSEPLRMSRLRARGMSVDEISARDALQLPAGEKAEMADVVLFNEGSLPFLREQAALFLSRIQVNAKRTS